MLKRLLLGLVTISLFSLNSFAQDDDLNDLDLEFESSPLEETKAPYFAVAGGFIGTYFFPGITDINDHLKQLDFLDGKGLPENFFMFGGEGFTAIGIIPNIRIGIRSIGGAAYEEINVPDDAIQATRSVEFHVGMTGVGIDYAIVPFRKFAIMPGINLNLGDVTITSAQANDNITWEEFQPMSDDNNYMEVFESSFIGVEPKLNIEYALNQFVMFRAGVSYALTFMGDWTYNGLSTVNESASDIGAGLQDTNGSGLGINFGVFVGLFNY